MARVGWYPLKDLEEFFHQQAARPAQHSHGARESVTSADWTPPVDISETAEAYRLEVELTGISRDDVDLSLNEGVLLIQGERPVPDDSGRRYHRLERPHGHFLRRFELPDTVDAGEITAEFDAGMLVLTLPRHRKQPAKTTQIPIR